MRWQPRWALGNVGGRLSDQELQDRLFRYLSTGVEEVDLVGPPLTYRGRVIEGWRKTRPELFADEREECDMLSAWRTIQATRKMKPGIWYRHGAKSPFRNFLYGTKYCGMATSANRGAKATVDCTTNLLASTPESERVWGFAYPARMTAYGKSIRRSRGLWTDEDEKIDEIRQNHVYRGSLWSKYGQAAVYFKTNAAVEAWHLGDNDWQIIFPLCSEYDVFTSDDAKQFPNGADDAMDYIDSGKGKFSGLSGLTSGPRFAFQR
jgi:hypothetical protein